VTRNRARSDLTSQPRFIEPVDEPSHLTVLYQVSEGVTLGFPNRQRADLGWRTQEVCLSPMLKLCCFSAPFAGAGGVEPKPSWPNGVA
jgi:hypothetical protein